PATPGLKGPEKNRPWRGSPSLVLLTHGWRPIHTSGPLRALPAPLLWLLLKPLQKILAVILGRSIRKWWMESPVTGRTRLLVFTQENYVELAAAMAKGYLEEFAEHLVPVDDPRHQLVERMVQHLAERNQDLPEVSSIPWTVHVVDNPTVNAFNGEVFMFDGMLQAVSDIHQLTFVLGHEMAHAILGHSASLSHVVDFLSLILLTSIWAVCPRDSMAVLGHWVQGKLVQACADVRAAPVFWQQMEIGDQLRGEPSALEMRDRCECPVLPAADPRLVFSQSVRLLLDKISTLTSTLTSTLITPQISTLTSTLITPQISTLISTLTFTLITPQISTQISTLTFTLITPQISTQISTLSSIQISTQISLQRRTRQHARVSNLSEREVTRIVTTPPRTASKGTKTSSFFTGRQDAEEHIHAFITSRLDDCYAPPRSPAQRLKRELQLLEFRSLTRGTSPLEHLGTPGETHWNTLEHLGKHTGIPWSTWGNTGIPWNTWGHTGIPWNTWGHLGKHWNTLEHLGKHWNTLEHLGTPGETLEYPGTPGDTWGNTGIPWNTLEHLGHTGTPGNTGDKLEYPGTPGDTLEYPGTPWNTWEHTGTSWNTLEHPGTHWNTLEHLGTNWNTWEHPRTHWNTWEPTGIPWNTLEYPGTHCPRVSESTEYILSQAGIEFM
ncbi:hypothetical protein NHX12_033998, partial [Muraenolepis orangiensis]